MCLHYLHLFQGLDNFVKSPQKSCYLILLLLLLSRNSRWNHTQIFSDFGDDDDDEENDNGTEFGRSRVHSLSTYGSRAASQRYVNFLEWFESFIYAMLILPSSFASVIFRTAPNDCRVFASGILCFLCLQLAFRTTRMSTNNFGVLENQVQVKTIKFSPNCLHVNTAQ